MARGDSQHSNVSLVERLSCNIFITNFPSHLSVKELWSTCAQQGTVTDVYIPKKVSKQGKSFAFARFIKVTDVDLLIKNLRSGWLGSYHLYANLALFNREFKSPPTSSVAPRPTTTPFNPKVTRKTSKASFANVVQNKDNHVNGDDNVINLEPLHVSYENNQVLVGCVKDFKTISNLRIACTTEGFSGIKFTYLGGFWILLEFDSIQSCSKFLSHVGINSWFSSLRNWSPSFEVTDRVVWIDVEGLPISAWSHSNLEFFLNKWGDLVYLDSDDSNKYSSRLCVRTKANHIILEPVNVAIKGKIITIRAKEVTGWVPTFEKSKSDNNSVSIHNWEDYDDVAISNSFQGFEFGLILKSANKHSKLPQSPMPDSDPSFPPGFTPDTSLHLKNVTEKIINDCSPSLSPEYNKNASSPVPEVEKPATNNENVSGNEHFESPKSSKNSLTLGKQWAMDLNFKRALWSFISGIIDRWNGEVIIMGDFNEVRFAYERYGSFLHPLNAAEFNAFIASSNLINIPLGGYSYTWTDKYASKMSKLDRFLVSQGTMDLFPNLSGLVLHRNISDHMPILLKEVLIDYGPTPFRLFHSWFSDKDFDAVIDQRINNGTSLPDDLANQSSASSELLSIDIQADMDAAQRSKVTWAIEGDENTKFFRGIINKRRRHLAIKGILIDGEWIEDSVRVKSEFFNHFANQFSEPGWSRTSFDGQFPNLLDPVQSYDLESDITNEEIKKAVWDCGSDTSPEKALMFKVDFRKAFDSVRWDHFDDIMDKIGFGLKWRKWIRGCLTSSKASVLVNGAPTDEFSFYRGLRQGDPLSPFLFILVIESLHVSFQRIIDRVNMYKSCIYGVGVPFKNIEELAESYGCLASNLPLTYLGVKVGANMNRIDSWNDVVQKIGILKAVANLKFKGVDLLGYCKIVLGNGQSTQFWHDIWLDNMALKVKFPRLYQLENHKDDTVANKLHCPGLTSTFRRTPRSGIEGQQFSELTHLISLVSLSPSSDRWSWTLNGTGDFSVKSVREWIDSQVLPSSSSSSSCPNLSRSRLATALRMPIQADPQDEDLKVLSRDPLEP
nr:hypothetical protein [Tanacetum cinerariifolium]